MQLSGALDGSSICHSCAALSHAVERGRVGWVGDDHPNHADPAERAQLLANRNVNQSGRRLVKGVPDRILERCTVQTEPTGEAEPLDREFWGSQIDGIGAATASFSTSQAPSLPAPAPPYYSPVLESGRYEEAAMTDNRAVIEKMIAAATGTTSMPS